MHCCLSSSSSGVHQCFCTPGLNTGIVLSKQHSMHELCSEMRLRCTHAVHSNAGLRQADYNVIIFTTVIRFSRRWAYKKSGASRRYHSCWRGKKSFSICAGCQEQNFLKTFWYFRYNSPFALILHKNALDPAGGASAYSL